MGPHPAHDAAPVRTARCWSLVTEDGSVDVEVTAHDDEHVGAVLSAVEGLLGVRVEGLWAGSTRLPERLPLTAPEVAHGAVLGLAGPVRRSGFDHHSSALELHVVGGPDAGRTVPLGQGPHVLGRGAEATLPLDDPDVSRRHVAVQIGDGDVTVTDLGSTNGSRLGRAALGTTSRSWRLGEVLRLGATAVALAGPGGPVASARSGPGGRSELRPTPRMRTPAPEVEVAFPAEPTPSPRNRLAWVAIALPAVGGIVMSWVLQTPTFLFFALLGPLVTVGTWLSDRWSGRRTGRGQRAAYEEARRLAEDQVTAAVSADIRAAESAHPDPATLASAVRRRSHLLWSRRLGDPDALSVRIGTGPGATRVTRTDPDGRRVRETADDLPAVVELPAGGGMAVVGPRAPAVGALASVVAQLAALHAPGDVDLVLLVGADRMADWAWTKWLPHLDPGAVHISPADRSGAAGRRQDEALNAWLTALAARRRALANTRPHPSGVPGALGRLVVLVDRRLDPRIAATLRASRDAGVLVLALADEPGSLPVDVDTVLRLTGETGNVAVLSREGCPDRGGIVVDRLSIPVANTFARNLAALTPAATTGALPRDVRLLDLPVSGMHLDPTHRLAGAWTRERDRLVAYLGRTADGPVEIDLFRDGPHALIAGTTGSGKSELLQTLITSLALRHPPDRCSFLLVDYKGGAAFAEAADLPQTVGLLTDLDGQSTARALRSLTAELARREGILADHEVPDIAALPDGVQLARLVIVVDEFATLAEELPAFVPGLVAIAQRGRSLGVHLVLATQRPGGVVSPEIRANCTLRICLRTTDDADSRDVLGTPQAAYLPVDRPGRAYLRVGSGEPALLQVARVSTAPRSLLPTAPAVRRWTWPAVDHPSSGVSDSAPETDLAVLTRVLTEQSRASGMPAPHRPWHPPLPDEFHSRAGWIDGGRPAGTRLPLGLLDLPDRQMQEELELDLGAGGGWLAVGGPRSGRTTLLRTVLREAVGRLAPADLHVHVIDLGGGGLAAEAAGLPHTGTSISGADPLRTTRLVDRLAAEVADRRAAPADMHRPLVLLLVDGMEALTSILDEADPAAGSAGLLRLMRDGAAAGVTCVVTADRAVPGGRLAAAVRQRLVLPLPDRADYAIAGVPARAVPSLRPPGRALLGEDAVECQLALPGPLSPRVDDSIAGGTNARLHIAELPADPVMDLPDTGTTPPAQFASGSLPLAIGPGGDEGEPVSLDLLRGGGLLITGPPGSGRTSALAAFARHLAALGVPLLWIGRSPADSIPSEASQWDAIGSDPTASDLIHVDPQDQTATARWLSRRDGTACVVIADDVSSPTEFQALTALPALGRSTGVALVAAGSAGQFTAHYQGPVAHLRRARSGLLLTPGPGEADLLGLRLPRLPLPNRPGSGWLATPGGLQRVQVARQRIQTAASSSR